MVKLRFLDNRDRDHFSSRFQILNLFLLRHVTYYVYVLSVTDTERKGQFMSYMHEKKKVVYLFFTPFTPIFFVTGAAIIALPHYSATLIYPYNNFVIIIFIIIIINIVFLNYNFPQLPVGQRHKHTVSDPRPTDI